MVNFYDVIYMQLAKFNLFMCPVTYCPSAWISQMYSEDLLNSLCSYTRVQVTGIYSSSQSSIVGIVSALQPLLLCICTIQGCLSCWQGHFCATRSISRLGRTFRNARLFIGAHKLGTSTKWICHFHELS